MTLLLWKSFYSSKDALLLAKDNVRAQQLLRKRSQQSISCNLSQFTHFYYYCNGSNSMCLQLVAMTKFISEQEPTILGLCNPLLDVTAYVDTELLNKYKLKPNNVIIAGPEHENLCEEIRERYKVDYTAGGSSQNTMRVIAGLLCKQNVKSKVLFTGCIGEDEYGSMMSEKAKQDGVRALYSISETDPTGTCVVCLTDQGKNRSLCSFLGASTKFSEQHLLDHWKELVAGTDIIYFSGFLITASPKSFHLLGEHIAKCNDTRKRFCLNLSAPYVSLVYGEQISKVMEYVDILFGNADEAFAYAEYMKWNTKDLGEIATRICQGEKVRANLGRLVIITQGDKPILMANQIDGKVKLLQFPCKSIEENEMVDTNGAGDAFVGGFLSQFMQGAPLEFCLAMGSYAAREIIKVSGISIPNFENIPRLGGD